MVFGYCRVGKPRGWSRRGADIAAAGGGGGVRVHQPRPLGPAVRPRQGRGRAGPGQLHRRAAHGRAGTRRHVPRQPAPADAPYCR